MVDSADQCRLGSTDVSTPRGASPYEGGGGLPRSAEKLAETRFDGLSEIGSAVVSNQRLGAGEPNFQELEPGR
jgi:hypothetical protein